jgi:hypothetical protein
MPVQPGRHQLQYLEQPRRAHACEIAFNHGSDSLLVQDATYCGCVYNWFYPLGEPTKCANILVALL